jgi:hypothetical protein
VNTSSPVDQAQVAPHPLATLRLALWFGLLAGLGEVVLLAVRKYVLHRPAAASDEVGCRSERSGGRSRAPQEIIT